MISKPRRSLKYLLLVILFLLCGCNSCYKTDWLTEIKDGKERSYQIIEALEKYRFEKGRYPSSLSDLLPVYLQSIPSTTTNQKFQYFIYKNGTYELTFHLACRTDLNTNCTYTKQDNFWDCSISIED
jgi:hypothetical protein